MFVCLRVIPIDEIYAWWNCPGPYATNNLRVTFSWFSPLKPPTRAARLILQAHHGCRHWPSRQAPFLGVENGECHQEPMKFSSAKSWNHVWIRKSHDGVLRGIRQPSIHHKRPAMHDRKSYASGVMRVFIWNLTLHVIFLLRDIFTTIFICKSTYLYMYLYIYISIYGITHSLNQSITKSIYRSINYQSINLSIIDLSIYQSTSIYLNLLAQSMYLSIFLSSNLSIYLSIYLSISLSMYLCIL